MTRPDAASGQTPHRVDFDTELQRHNEVLRRAVGVRDHDHVLDIGCGTGQTTRDAARRATTGNALGVDISGAAIERARQRANAEGLHNVTFEQADAASHSFTQDFDVAISRFGTMFFDAPVDAFANIRRALRPTGRLAMMVWQARELNDWAVAIDQALRTSRGPGTSSRSRSPDPFSLADQRVVTEMLESAGFVDVAFADVDEPVYYGPDAAAALAWVCGFTSTTEVLERLEPAAARAAVDRLSQTLAARLSNNGIWFGSRAWIVSARHH